MTDNELFNILKNKFGGAKKGNGYWIRIKCPTCTPSDAVKMKRGVHLRTLSTNCFICRKPISWEDIFGDTPITPATGGTLIEDKEHPQARTWPCKGLVPISALPEDHPAVKFLAKDFITDRLSLWTNHRVGYITAEDSIDIWFEKFDGSRTSVNTANSLVFPVYYSKELVGWQIRFVPGTPHGDRMGKMRYLHVLKKGNYLYNYDNAREYSSVVLVEGVKKAWKFPNAVASLGKGITERQIQLLQHWDEIILMYDGDAKTQQQAEFLRSQIVLNRKCVNVNPTKYGFASPDEMTSEQAQAIAFQEWKNTYGSI
jgi:hypothetical protein